MQTSIIIFLLAVGLALLVIAIRIITRTEKQGAVVARLEAVIAAKNNDDPPMSKEEIKYWNSVRWD